MGTRCQCPGPAGAPTTPGGHGATRALDGAILLRTGKLDAIELDRLRLLKKQRDPGGVIRGNRPLLG